MVPLSAEGIDVAMIAIAGVVLAEGLVPAEEEVVTVPVPGRRRKHAADWRLVVDPNAGGELGATYWLIDVYWYRSDDPAALRRDSSPRTRGGPSFGPLARRASETELGNGDVCDHVRSAWVRRAHRRTFQASLQGSTSETTATRRREGPRILDVQSLESLESKCRDASRTGTAATGGAGPPSQKRTTRYRQPRWQGRAYGDRRSALSVSVHHRTERERENPCVHSARVATSWGDGQAGGGLPRGPLGPTSVAGPGRQRRGSG